MLRKFLALAALLMLLALPALAVNDGCRAWPNQRLHFRTGPNTAFTDLYTLPQDTKVYAIELEEGNDVTWVLCEFEYQGQRVRGYTGLKRFSLDHSLAWADHAWLERRVVNAADIYAASDDNSAVRGHVRAGDTLTFLSFEGDYCLVEYRRGQQRERGYVHAFAFWVDQDEFGEWFPDNPTDTWYVVRRPSAEMHEGPSSSSPVLYTIPYDRCVAIDCSEGNDGDWLRFYYGGAWGYGRRDDFNDLRGIVESER